MVSKPQLRVLHVTAAGKTTGAGSAAVNIQQALISKNIDARVIFLANEEEDENAGIKNFSNTFYKKYLRFLFTTMDRLLTWAYPNRKKQIFSPGLFGQQIHKHKEFIAADIIHLHWINHGFISIKELKKINKPMVWTMHDMWAFTGGCHYSFECSKYLNNCGNCPVLQSDREEDLSRKVLTQKVNEIPVDSITFVSISEWMRGMADRSRLLKGAAKDVIYSGINTDVFNYQSKDAARLKLGLPADRQIILMGANDLLNPAKGVGFSIEALRKVSKNILVITFGNGQLDNSHIDQEIINIGFISDRIKMAAYYAAADLFLATSVAEAFGMTLAEAQCCGTPVVAFSEGGPLDIVRHEQSGYLAKYPVIADLVVGITYVLTNQIDRRETSNYAISKFSIAQTASQYEKIYNDLMNNYAAAK